MSNQGNVASSIDGDARERESSDDSRIGRVTLIPIGAIEPEERWRHMMHSLNASATARESTGSAATPHLIHAEK